MPKAARLGDSIGHTPPGDGPIGGIGDVTGKIVGPCSSNVFTNGIKAARAYVDVVVCALHPQAPLPIATGSSTVFINGLPAARVSDKIVCRAYITDGSANVFIGGAAVQTNSFMPEGIFEEVVELVENGATLVLGAGEIVVGGFYNSVVRIGAGLASIPYMLDSVDAAVGVQKEIAEGLNYNFRSDGAKQIGEALKPVGTYVQEKITVAKDFSEEHIGLGATAVVFGGVEAGVEIAGVVTGGRVLKSFIDVPKIKSPDAPNAPDAPDRPPAAAVPAVAKSVFDVRTPAAFAEAEKVAGVMKKFFPPDKSPVIQVLTHKDGTVSVGLSGDLSSPKTARRMAQLQAGLDKNLGKDKYKVGSTTLDGNDSIVLPRDSRGQPLGNQPGFCAEPKACTAAAQNKSPINGSATYWRSDLPNPHPHRLSDADGSPSREMNPCATCAHPPNQEIYNNTANSGKNVSESLDE